MIFKSVIFYSILQKNKCYIESIISLLNLEIIIDFGHRNQGRYVWLLIVPYMYVIAQVLFF